MVPDEWPIAAPSDDGRYPARAAGRRRLPTVRKDFFLDPRDRLTEQERALMTAMLAELLEAISEEIRAGLPANFLPANDDDSQQLLRSLAAAGLLDQVDLITLLLRRADEERIANAVRVRSAPRGGSSSRTARCRSRWTRRRFPRWRSPRPRSRASSRST